MKFLIITGMSGAGKSLALDFFEDRGYFCIDNLPPTLISKFAELMTHSQLDKIAVVCDARGGKFFSALFNKLSYLDDRGIDYEILFLEASNKALIRRYKETRRRHPLDEEGSVLDSIQKERQLLEELKGKANQIIDTSTIDSKEFHRELERIYSDYLETAGLTISLISFGYKYGIPLDADMVMDVRFLPNPHYVNSLREKTGEEQPVQEYIMKWPITRQFYDKLFSFVDFLLPEYNKEGKSHFSLAIGCTGGKHRAVTTAIKLKEYLKSRDYRVSLKHRDMDK